MNKVNTSSQYTIDVAYALTKEYSLIKHNKCWPTCRGVETGKILAELYSKTMVND